MCVCSSILPWHILPSILEGGSSWQRPLCSCLPTAGLAALSQVLQPGHCHSDPASPLLTQTTSAGGKPPAQTGPTKAPHCLAHPFVPLIHLLPRGPHLGGTSLPSFHLPILPSTHLWSQRFPGFQCFAYWVPSLAAFGLLCPSAHSSKGCLQEISAGTTSQCLLGATAEQSEPAPGTA